MVYIYDTLRPSLEEETHLEIFKNAFGIIFLTQIFTQLRNNNFQKSL